LALAEEDDEEGSEMERREKSSIAFLAGLSLISSPDNRAERKKDFKTFLVPLLSGNSQGERKELTEGVWAGLRGLALDPDDDGLLPRRGPRGGRLAGVRRRHDRRLGRFFF